MNLFLLHFSSSGSYAPQKKCEHAWFKSVKQWFFFDHLQQPSNERIDPRRGKKWLNKNPGQTLPPGGEGPGVWEFDRFFFLCIWSPVFFFLYCPWASSCLLQAWPWILIEQQHTKPQQFSVKHNSLSVFFFFTIFYWFVLKPQNHKNKKSKKENLVVWPKSTCNKNIFDLFFLFFFTERPKRRP